MNEQRIRMIYSPAQVDSPVINELVREYLDLTINIIRANISIDGGWMEVQLVGNPALIENAIQWLQTRGIDVQAMGA
jgi:ABC-type methionine transport system ATPase subunit